MSGLVEVRDQSKERRCALMLAVGVAAGTSGCGPESPPSGKDDGGAIEAGSSTGSPSTGGPLSGSGTTEDEGSTTTAEEPQACMASSECDDSEVCAAGVCAPTDGECSSDDDCSGDTYCCAEGCLPEGEDGGWCIPYGTGTRGPINEQCKQEVVIGLFEPSVQCEWTAPAHGHPYPYHINVLATPMVAPLPHDSGAANELVIVTYNGTDGGNAAAVGDNPEMFGVIRVLNGQTCELMETIADPNHSIIAASPPSIADLDGDGIAEIVTQHALSGLIAFQWNPATGRYRTMWIADDSDISGLGRWDGPAIHDIDDDGQPEVISGSEVYDGSTGERINVGQVVTLASAGHISVLGDLDSDGTIELIAGDVYEWSTGMLRWEYKAPGGPGGRHYAFADFGTAGATPEAFDPTTLDGIAEIVVAGNNMVALHTLAGHELFRVDTEILGGGPPTIGDFDNDGLPEIASAGGNFYRVFDLECSEGASATCHAQWIRWAQASQDLSSRTTGSSIFDFEGDGQAEAVYADECFVRVYEGATGEVLYSAPRTSCTWYENAVVADVDGDQNTELIIGSNVNCNVTCPEIDPIHLGVRCENDAGCLSGACTDGFCTCADDTECGDGLVCAAAPDASPGSRCLSSHPPDIALSGVRVFRDRLDRWASSRGVWNQHAYSITNIANDLSVPSSSSWEDNFRVGGPNNYRQNEQGEVGADELPDITGHLEDATCVPGKSDSDLVGTVCNRGLRAAAAALPATFYLGDPADGNVLCVAYTAEPVPVGECREVRCTISSTLDGEVTMVVNDDGMGGALTVECNANNNTDEVVVQDCSPAG